MKCMSAEPIFIIASENFLALSGSIVAFNDNSIWEIGRVQSWNTKTNIVTILLLNGTIKLKLIIIPRKKKNS